MGQEGGSSIWGNKEAEANTEEDVLHKGSGKSGGVGGLEVHDDGESGEVAHGGKDVFAAIVAGDVAWLPDVNVDDGEGGGDWPRVN